MNNMILKENEWNTMNNILLDMYEIRDINELTDRLLKTFRMLIPYTQGYYLIFNKEVEEWVYFNYQRKKYFLNKIAK